MLVNLLFCPHLAGHTNKNYETHFIDLENFTKFTGDIGVLILTYLLQSDLPLTCFFLYFSGVSNNRDPEIRTSRTKSQDT